MRQVFYHADTARALARIGGRDREATRFLLTAERVAPQQMHTCLDLAATIRLLLERSRRPAHGTEIRAQYECMHPN